MEIIARNVNEALYHGVKALQSRGELQSSRAGNTIEVPEPVITTYLVPQEKVLFSKERDANPFFHFFEAMWMLAGRSDVEFVARVLPRIKDYSDDGLFLQGAYGYRWHHHFDFNQLEHIIELLKSQPNTRRAVLQMWDPNHDLEENIDSRDIPCNTAIYFKIRHKKLNMTVTNRSNDIIWGAYGANAVHMGFLQEYIAARVGVEVGIYVQFSDSFHVYTTGLGGDIWKRIEADPLKLTYQPYPLLVSNHPLGPVNKAWDEDMNRFFTCFDDGLQPEPSHYKTKWWRHVVIPLWLAFIHRDPAVLEACVAEDWQLAAAEWLERRAAKP